MPSKTQRRAAGESFAFLLSIGGILVLLNVLVAYFPSPRVDFTRADLFSLAEGSQTVASNLEDRLEITAYFTENLPPPFNATERQVRDLLAEYAAESNGDIVVRFVNPEDEETRAAAQEDGIQAVAHQKIEDDQVAVVEGYRGIVLKYLDSSKTIPVIQDTTGLEYTITSAIKELTGERKAVGIVTGHEGPSLERGLRKLQAVARLYDLRGVNAAEEIDQELAALLIISPKTQFSEQELRNIDRYVMRGGSLGVFGGALTMDLETGAPEAEVLNTTLNDLLGKWGVTMQPKMVADSQCSRAPMQGPLGLQVLVPYPPIPVLQLDAEQREHPVMFRLASPMLPFAAPLEVDESATGATLTSIADSSVNSWAMSGDKISVRPRRPEEWAMSADLGPFSLIVAIEGILPSAFVEPVSDGQSDDVGAIVTSEKEVRVLVVGTGLFLEDVFMPESRGPSDPQMNAALALALNAIDWLAADSDLIAIRAKTVEDPALDIPDSVLAAETSALAAAEEGNEAGIEEALETRKAAIKSWDQKKLAYRWANTIGIPVVVALFGLFRWRRRTAKKKSLKI